MHKPDCDLGPGDWCFVRADSYNAEGDPDRDTLGVSFKDATHVLFSDPYDNWHKVSVRGKGRQRNGATWTLTGDEDAPTLHPSVENSVWHGWFKNGQMRDA